MPCRSISGRPPGSPHAAHATTLPSGCTTFPSATISSNPHTPVAGRQALTKGAAQNLVVLVEPFAVEARLRPRSDADALGDHAPDRHLFGLPPRDRLLEVVRP